MSTPLHGALRAVRAAAFTGVALVLAVVAHTLAGGVSPSRAGVGVGAALTVSASVLLTGRRLGPVGVTTALGALQVALHAVFMLLPGGSCAAGILSMSMPPLGHGSAVPALGSCGAMNGMHPIGVPMLLAHAAATGLTALVLALGERSLWVLASWAPLAPRIPSALPVLPAPHRLTSARDIPCLVLIPAVTSSGSRRRGPPPWAQASSA